MHDLDANKATGIDHVLNAEYESNVEQYINSLVDRLRNIGYKPQPVRRTYIPKDQKSMRPLGILVYEDKNAQQGLNKLLQAIYKLDFVSHCIDSDQK